ncbi:MAG: hypothetical protein L0191_16860, partial [Acidobacteria bacterium]|nr:hypothetical protein [Acidobacteriota bacterium]
SGRKTGLILALAGSLLAATIITEPARAEEKSGASKDPASTDAKKSTQTKPTQKPSAAPKSAPGKKGPLVFTDEDLKKYNSGSSTQPARNVAPSGSPDPLKAIKEDQERALWRQKRTSELQQKVLDLEARLKSLEKRRLSIQNPLLPRTPGPEGTAEQEIGLSGPELLARTDEEIQHTNKQLEAARKDLATFLEKKPE